jgi:UDP-N-acetylmuramoylalanine--D-glutamate ligase
MPLDYRDKQVVVVGAGKSGLALCDYFCHLGARVVLSDRRTYGELPTQLAALENKLEFDLGGHTLELFRRADLVVISPGVPLDIPALAAAAAAGVKLVGEVEVAWLALQVPTIGITGTNGKSTTTALLGEIFSAWGKRTFVGGNLGVPLITATNRHSWSWLVVELSSFQLETIDRFHPRWSLLLNVSEDHLDRYPDMASYLSAKQRIFENQQASDFAVVNLDDPEVMRLAVDCRAQQIGFSSSRLPAAGMGLDGNRIVWRWQGQEHRFNVEQLRLKGAHNLENVMAAMIPPLVEGCPAEVVWAAVCSFPGLEHRMCLVRELDGVAWYNDSKGTNVGSVIKSLAGLPAPVTLIAGGKDKGGEYQLLRPALDNKVNDLILMGEAAAKMEQALTGCCRIHRVDSLQQAVELARQLTRKHGSVLLSPGCSSFDMFRSFEERGELFTRAVLNLADGKASS